MEIINLLLLSGSIIFLIEYVLTHNKYLFLFIGIGIIIIHICIIMRNIIQKSKIGIEYGARILKIVAVQAAVGYIYMLNHNKINDKSSNRIVYYLLILNILLIGSFEFYEYAISSHDNRFSFKLINGILILILAFFAPAPSSFGIHDNLYGIKDNILWIFAYIFLMGNFFFGYGDEKKNVTDILICSFIPFFAHLIRGNSFLLYRCVFLSIFLTALEYDPKIFYNSYEDKIKDFYLKNEYYFIGASIITTVGLFYQSTIKV